MEPVDYRYNPFTDVLSPVLISGELLYVPSGSPYRTYLREVPLQNDVSSVLIREVGAGTPISPSADSYVYEGNPSTNYGASGIIAAGRNTASPGNSYRYRGLMQFDLSSITAAITSARLRINREIGYSAPTYAVHRATASWSGAGVTWANQPAYDLVAAGAVPITPGVMGWYEIDITALCEQWRSGAAPNYGLVLRTDEVQTDTVSNWTSQDSGATASRPVLMITTSGSNLEEVPYNVAPAAGQFALYYPTGDLLFNVAQAGLTFAADYYGIGSVVRARDVITTSPASITSPGLPNQIASDGSYIYYCIALNTWRRATLATWS